MATAKKRSTKSEYYALVHQVAKLQGTLNKAHDIGSLSAHAIALEFIAGKGLLGTSAFNRFAKLLEEEVRLSVQGKSGEAIAEFDDSVVAYLRRKYASTVAKMRKALKTKEQKEIFRLVCRTLDPDDQLLLTSKNKNPLPFSSLYTALAIVEISEVMEEIKYLKSSSVKIKLGKIAYITKQSFVNFIDSLNH